MMFVPTVRRSLFVAIPALAASLAVSCGGEDTSTVNGGKGSAGRNGTAGTLSLGTDGSGNPVGSGGSATGVTTITRDAACADGSGTADAIPAVVEMVIDISGSMDWGANGSHNPPRNKSKWDITKAALTAAVANLPANIAVGINFYPNGGGDRNCINNRIDLPIGLLDAASSPQRRAFNAAVGRARPGGGTPTHAAYKFGSETVAASMLAGRKFVLLITDGIPTFTLDCRGDGQNPVDDQPLIDEVASSAKASISTFVIGSPGSEDARGDLSKMATNGGTAKAGCSDAGPTYCHLDMTTATDFGAALSAGLAEVAGQIGTCEFTVPPAPAGKTLNPKYVNVLYTNGAGKETSIPQDAKGDCMSGWKYDDKDAPTKITLCGTDCDAVKADQGARVDVIFGCETKTNVPVK